MEESTTTTTTTVLVEPKTLDDIYDQNSDITYLLMGVVALLIIMLIIRRY